MHVALVYNSLRNALCNAQVIVADIADGCAASGLLMKGDRLLAINGTRVNDEVQGRALIKAAEGEVVFSIMRAEELATVTGL